VSTSHTYFCQALSLLRIFTFPQTTSHSTIPALPRYGVCQHDGPTLFPCGMFSTPPPSSDSWVHGSCTLLFQRLGITRAKACYLIYHSAPLQKHHQWNTVQAFPTPRGIPFSNRDDQFADIKVYWFTTEPYRFVGDMGIA
jgi:hypothetical protein